jgi:hypothetical protein
MNLAVTRKHLIVSRALALYILVVGLKPFLFHIQTDSLPFLPFFPLFDILPSGLFSTALRLLIFAAAVSVFLNFHARLGSLVMGIATIVAIFSSMPLYSTSLTFASCLLIIASQYTDNNQVVRWQLGIVYLGAGLNKLLDPDWWNGSYFEYFALHIFNLPGYSYIENLLSIHPFFLGKCLGVTTIGLELLIGSLFIAGKKIFYPISLGLLFHSAMLIWTSGQLSMIYFYLMCAAYFLASDHIQTQSLTFSYGNSTFSKTLNRLDFFRSINWQKVQDDKTTVIFNENRYQSIAKVVITIVNHETLVYSFFLLILFVLFYSKIYHFLF